MSGPSRAEIVQLQDQWRGVLVRLYPGCAPEEVCAFYADIEQRTKKASGPPDLRLREMGRLLKSHLEKDCRGFADFNHRYLLATHQGLRVGYDLQKAKKQARREIRLSEDDPKHWLHRLVPQFKDGALLSDPPNSPAELAKLLQRQVLS